MIIDLASVGVSPKPIREALSAADIDLDDEGKLLGDVSVEGDIFKDGDKVHLKGKLSAEVEVACTRCLEQIEKHLQITFDDVFVDSSNEPSGDEIELAIEDMDVALVEGTHVDLADVVREQILLELPEVLTCRDDCKGLCQKCGQNLNLIDCNCESDDIDPRWAALKNLN